MSLIEEAMQEMKSDLLTELEQRIWDRLEPRIRQELRARHMSIADTAEYLHVSEQTIRRMVRDKEIPSFRIRNQIFVRQMDIDVWVDEQIKNPEGR